MIVRPVKLSFTIPAACKSCTRLKIRPSQPFAAARTKPWAGLARNVFSFFSGEMWEEEGGVGEQSRWLTQYVYRYGQELRVLGYGRVVGC